MASRTESTVAELICFRTLVAGYRVWVQRWVVEFSGDGALLQPRLRWSQYLPVGLSLLGEFEGSHHGVVKPHTVRSISVDRRASLMTATVCWLADRYDAPVDPISLVGRRFAFGGSALQCVATTLAADVDQRDLLGEVFLDPLLPDPVGSIVDPVVEFRVRSASPWVFATGDPATEFHPGRLVARLARRWNEMLVWRPDSTPGDRGAATEDSVPQEVIGELAECTSAVSMSRFSVSEQRLTFDPNRRQTRTRHAVEVDAVIRCSAGSITTLLWFQTLMRFAVWSGVATRTTSGLGQVDIDQVRRLSDLPHAVVPEWEIW